MQCTWAVRSAATQNQKQFYVDAEHLVILKLLLLLARNSWLASDSRQSFLILHGTITGSGSLQEPSTPMRPGPLPGFPRAL